MSQKQPSVNKKFDADHLAATEQTLAMLLRPGKLDQARDRLDAAWAHPDYARIYRALLDLPSGTSEPLPVLPQGMAVKVVPLAGNIETPVHLDTAITWLHQAWAQVENDRALQTGDPQQIAETYARTRAGPQAQKANLWDLARSQFPRRPVPWEHLPASLAASFQQLARSCATSPTALPGAAMCILASIVGRNVSISPKTSWAESLIFWMGDIRKSGEGKTPPARKLSEIVTHTWQVAATKKYEKEKAEYDAHPKKEREGIPEPDPPHSYYLTSLTMEGIRDQMASHPTGGLIAIQDELSAMIAGQNEYKSKGGSDREAWLCLHDGHPARIARAGKVPTTITGARVQVYGGIQPEIFRRAFGGNGGTYLHDGTLYRFLLTFDREQFHELTAESWTHNHQKAWEVMLERAQEWTQSQDEKMQMVLGQDAQARFLIWANSIRSMMPDLPDILRGYVPKAVGYALRIAGILHLMTRFEAGEDPMQVLGVDDIEAGIAFAEFYLGQALDAMRYLTVDQTHSPIEFSERDKTLLQALESMRSEVDSGRLAVGYVREQFNQRCQPEQAISSPHAMGGWLRGLGLNISNGLHDANQKKRVRCLLWDEKLREVVSQVSEVSKPTNDRGFETETCKKQSLTSLADTQDTETCETSRVESLAPETCVNSKLRDKRDKADNFPEQNQNGVEI